MNGIKRYLLSSSNMVGCSAAALVSFLFLLGVLNAYWIGLACIAYTISALAFWRPATKSLAPGLDTMEYMAWLSKEVVPNVPIESASTLIRILDVVNEIWPRLKEMQEEGLVQYSNREEIKQALTVFLPELVVNYLKLPSKYARTHKIDGKTPALLLEEQLKMLETHINAIRDNVYAKDVESLRTHGRFLKEMLDPKMIIR